MEFNSYIFTKDRHLCSGCAACVQVCKQGALVMRADDEGFLYPELDKEKCIKCGACVNVCPVVNNKAANDKQDQHCYVATTNDAKYFKESASIGLCTMLSELIVGEGGIVFGVYLDETVWKAYHIPVFDWAGLESVRNSKYLQSDTRNTYSEVKGYLLKGVKVLYIGTPCQIAGLKAYLRKDYQNLYTIDIICHGVFSPKLMPLEILYWERLFKGNIVNFRFRSKRKFKHINGGLVNFDVIKKNGSLRHVERHASSSPTYRAYAYAGDGISHNLRLSCYNCPFRSERRYGDITVGDPWDIKDELIQKTSLKSTNSVRSLFSSNTSKGYELLNQVLDKMDYQEMDYDLSFVQDAVIPIARGKGKRDEIYSRIDNEKYNELIEDIFKCNLEESHKLFERNYYIKTIKRTIRNIFGNLI
jgi:NAD-dependent dihydropyrimidine dehydrogenase PreA subunit